MQNGKIIRTTISLCPVCRERIPARAVEESGAVFLEKTCPEHGPFRSLIARHASYYADFFRLYGLLQSHFPYHREEIESAAFSTTLACNMKCAICFADDAERKTPPGESLAEIKRKLEPIRGRGINFKLTGGESTLRDDLPEIIRLVRESGNYPVLVTNALRLDDREYLRTLQEAGLVAIAPWFDSSSDGEIYRKIRGQDLLAQRRKVMDHVRELGLKLIVFFVCLKGVNESELPGILGMARENPEIFKVIVMGYMHRGAKGFSEENEYTTDELWEVIARASGVFSSLEDLYLAIKINLISRALRGIYHCYNSQFVLMPRSDRPADGFDPRRWGPVVRRFEEMLPERPARARLYFLRALGRDLIGKGFLGPLAERFLLRRKKLPDTFIPAPYYWLQFQYLYYPRNYDEEMVRGFCPYPSFNPGLEKPVSFCEYYNLKLKT